MEEKLFLEGTCTALAGGDLGVWHSQPIQTPAWQPGEDYTTQLGVAVPPGSHYLTSSGAPCTHGECPSSQCWWKHTAWPEPFGWMPPVPQLWLLLLPALQSFSSYFLGSLTLGMLWLKCRRLILRMFLSQFSACCHLPLDAFQFHKQEWELKSWSDFSPMRAGRSRYLFRKAFWVVSNFFFFSVKCSKMFSYTLGKYPSPWLLAWRSLEAFSRSDCLLSSVTMCAAMLENLHPIYVPEKQDYHPSQTGMKWPSPSFSFDSWRFFSVCH